MPDAASLPSLSITVARRRRDTPLDPELRERLQRICGINSGAVTLGAPQRDGDDHESIWSVSLSSLFSVLDVVGRDRTLVAVVWLVEPNQRKSAAHHALRKARARSDGLWVSRPPVAAQAHVAIDGLLSLHLATLRGRTAAQWRAIDARRRSESVAAAVAQLGFSRQNMSHTLTRANVKVTTRTRAALQALLELWLAADAASNRAA